MYYWIVFIATVMSLDQAELSNTKAACTNNKQIVETILAAYKYQRRPNEVGVMVTVEVWVQEVTSVNELTSDFTLDIYVTELWVDTALNYERLNPCKQNVSLNHEMLDRIWKPNTVFINTKHAQIHNSPFRNVFLMVYPNGTVWTNYRMKVVGPCSIDFSSFPMDYQHCFLTMESFSYNHDEVEMVWNPQGSALLLIGENPVELPDFILSNWSTKMELKQYPAGMWSELTMNFKFKRRIDVWMLACFMFVFWSVIELAVVAYGSQNDERRWVKKVDKYSCIIFPASFSLFNIVYWCYYIFHSSSQCC